MGKNMAFKNDKARMAYNDKFDLEWNGKTLNLITFDNNKVANPPNALDRL